MKKKWKWILAVVVLLPMVALGVWSFRSSLTPYVSFPEAQASTNPVQVMGFVDRTTIKSDTQTRQLQFTILDSVGRTMPVVYDGPTPGNLEQAKSVVCVGTFRDGHFKADQLLVKCPTKYQAQTAAGERK